MASFSSGIGFGCGLCLGFCGICVGVLRSVTEGNCGSDVVMTANLCDGS